jgi:hypothetical protein
MTRSTAIELLRKAKRPPYRHAFVVVTIAIVMAALFVASYSLALGRPTPHNIPAGVVGNQAAEVPLIAALKSATGHGLALQPFPSAAAAQRAIAEQRIYAALLLAGQRSELLIASAAGTSVARVLEQAANAVAQRDAGSLPVRDLHPLPAGDPQGLVSFYATLAATILGFVTMFQLRANAPQLSLRAWWGAIGMVALAGGLLLALVLGPMIGALPAPFSELWGALSAQIAVAALFNSTMITLVGRWAILPTWGFFVAFGNASSGGAVAPPLLPAFYGFVGRFLPAGATVEIVRNASYFQGHQHLEPMLVQAGWIVGAAIAFGLAARFRGGPPGQV